MATLPERQTNNAYSGLLDNFYVTLAIAAVCLVGHEIEVHVPRRRGKDGTFKRIPVRIVHAIQREWKQWHSGRRKTGEGEERTSEEGLVREKAGINATNDRARQRLGSRESWEFG